jgi:hypothetical protein
VNSEQVKRKNNVQDRKLACIFVNSLLENGGAE